MIPAQYPTPNHRGRDGFWITMIIIWEYYFAHFRIPVQLIS